LVSVARTDTIWQRPKAKAKRERNPLILKIAFVRRSAKTGDLAVIGVSAHDIKNCTK
jgi:hypothetical protein